MPDVAKLKQAIRDRTGFSDRHVNRLISAKAKDDLLPRPVATMAVARDHGIAIDRYATEQDLALLRGSAQKGAPAPAPVLAPTRQATSPTARRTTGRATASRPKAKPRSRKKVFVVHGRNEALRKDMFAFLRAIGLTPLEWSKGLAATQSGSPSIPEVLDALFREAGAVLVLLTPDDTARLKPLFQSRSDPAHEKRFVGQARPNVLFEAGMAFASHPGSVVLVRVGDVKGFTDIDGLHVTRLDNSPTKRQEVATKLKNAGCDVDVGGSEWFTTGDFDPSEERGTA